MKERLTLIEMAGGKHGSSAITARRAALAIGGVTVIVTVISGVAMRWVDQTDFDSIWDGLWWAVQTVTTVGYGDAVPKTPAGQILATVVMLTGIGFIAVVTAAITAAFIESARRRLAAEALDPLDDPAEDQILHKLDEILARLDRLENRTS
jgi:voltage-gated potassium channel